MKMYRMRYSICNMIALCLDGAHLSDDAAYKRGEILGGGGGGGGG